MKKTISILMCFLAVVLIGIGVCQESNNQILTYGNLEKTYCDTFMVPDRDEICDPDILFQILLKTARESSANIIRTSLSDGEKEGAYELVKYVLIQSENSQYLRSYEMQSGTMLTTEDTMNANSIVFVSTKDIGEAEQVGRIKSHMLHMDVTVRPLSALFDYSKANGLYYVELTGNATIEDFQNALHENILEYTGIDVDVSELEGQQSTVGIPYMDLTQYYIVLGFVILLFILLVFYYLLKKRRDVAIMRLMGTKDFSIWKKMFAEPIAVFPVVIILLTILVSVIMNDWSYGVGRVTSLLLFYVLTVLFFGVAYKLATRKLIFSSALKGQNYTTGILALQTIAEIICLVFILYSGASAFVALGNIQQSMNQYHSWAVAEDYGVFYPLKIGNEQTAEEADHRDAVIGNELYHELNERGALLIDASQFEDGYLEVNAGYISAAYEQSIKVNPNYLQAFTVLDEYGAEVLIDESESALILLVPETEKENEEDIIDYYSNQQLSFRDIDSDVYGIETDPVDNQEIRIIWTQSGQHIFTFNTSANVDIEGITDPILVVYTEGNSYVCQRIGVLGKGNPDPLKVKLIGTSKETYDSLNSILKELDLDDNLTALISVNDQAQETLTVMRANLMIALRLLAVLLIMMVYLIYQSTYLVFEKHKKEYAVKQLFGMRWNKIYGKQCAVKIALIVAIIVVYAIFIKLGGISYILLAAGLMIGIQLIVMSLCITRQLRTKRSDIMKGV